MNDKYAIVTGGSQGIGKEYATQLARDYGYNLLLVSNQETVLPIVAQELSKNYLVDVQWLCVDLSQLDAAEQIITYCNEHQLPIEVLINNAGMLIFEDLTLVPMKKLETLLMMHVVTATKLCKMFVETKRQMTPETERRRRYILNMSSMTAWMAMPGIQCYNASKGYILNFSRSLWYEAKRYGVHVMAVTPGSTHTGMLPFPPFWDRVLSKVGITMEPGKLVHRALQLLFRSWRKRCMPGPWNYIIVPIINHLPDWVVFAAMKRVM